MIFKILEFDELTSTNSYAKDHMASLNTGDVIYTEKQTAGKGRHGKTWEAPAGKNLSFSIVIKDIPSHCQTFPYIQTASLAIYEALNQLSIKEHWIKWPNDIYVSDRKIAGILCESILTRDKMNLVIGIGININSKASDFSPFAIKPTSLLLESSDDEDFVLKEVLTCVLNNYKKFSKLSDMGLNDILHQDWLSKTQLIGKEVTIIDSTTSHEGHVHDLLPNGALLLKQGESSQEFHSAEISLRV